VMQTVPGIPSAPPAPAVAITPPQPQAAPPAFAAKPPSINLDVNFEYASAQLTKDARAVLDNLGRALGSPELRAYRIRIAGHTDAAGSESYNMALSLDRAQVVADYLVREHKIDMARLTVQGFGKNRLLDPANPNAASNRRVEVVNLGTPP
jgi:OOP family OmpA-OmpF porin